MAMGPCVRRDDGRVFGLPFSKPTYLRVLAARSARGLLLNFPPTKVEGAGKTGCSLHPRSRVQSAQQKRTRAYRFSGNTPAFPAQCLYGLLRALPGERLSCHRRCANISTQLDASTAASGPHDFAVRFSHPRQSWHPRPPQPVPTFVTMADAPLRDRMATV